VIPIRLQDHGIYEARKSLRLIASPLDNQEDSCISFLLIIRRSGFMPDKPGDLVQGTLDMLILKTVALQPIHGYGIAIRIEQISKGVFKVNAGSLFVAFQRLQRDGLIKSEWKATENSRRAKYYVITERGRKRLSSETREWGKQVAAIARILEAS
jgi:PadR family transcriptional regulator, regulatory protein PadR